MIQDLQIKLLYCQYAWPMERIARLLGLTPLDIRARVAELQLTRATDIALKSPEEFTAAIGQLKADEVDKQRDLAPIIATIEMGLLQQLNNMITSAEDPDSLQALVKAFKQLTQDSVINTLVSDEQGKKHVPTVAVQVINRVD